MSFRIRRSFVRDEEGGGVVLITLILQRISETILDAIMNQAEVRGVKYAAPDL